MVASEGHSSERFLDLLSQYMKYKVNGPCPDDWSLGQRPIMQGCEPFPRRRCFSKSIPKILDVSAYDVGVAGWGTGLKLGSQSKGVKYNGHRNIGIALFVLATVQHFPSSAHEVGSSPPPTNGSGGTRTGFDIGGGSGTFTARMSERNVTIVTTTLNVDAPFSESIVARGLFPMYLSLNHRFLLYDNAFDLVHDGVQGMKLVKTGSNLQEKEEVKILVEAQRARADQVRARADQERARAQTTESQRTRADQARGRAVSG
ncbi:hypothetical protein AgCh_000703 [Apium graveolens]